MISPKIAISSTRGVEWDLNGRRYDSLEDLTDYLLVLLAQSEL